MPGLEISYLEAWNLWLTGGKLDDRTMFGLSFLWWGRAGKIIQFLGASALLAEVSPSQFLDSVERWADDYIARVLEILRSYGVFGLLVLVVWQVTMAAWAFYSSGWIVGRDSTLASLAGMVVPNRSPDMLLMIVVFYVNKVLVWGVLAPFLTFMVVPKVFVAFAYLLKARRSLAVCNLCLIGFGFQFALLAS